MNTATTITHWVIRITGVTQVVLGILFWTNRALTLLPFHMLVGMTFVVALWVLAGLAAWAGLRWRAVLLAVSWGVLIPVFGIMQMSLLPGRALWVVEATHLLIGVAAMIGAARLVHFIRQHRRTTAAEGQRTFVPAAGRDWRLPFYDVLAKLLGADRARKLLLEQASGGPAARILEIGSGTGSLVLLLKQAYPDAEVIGLDPDTKAHALARRKAERANVAIQLDSGFADELPYDDASFDAVFSAFMFHHLSHDEKARTMREVRRVLKPGGCFHMLDFGGPDGGAHGFVARRIHANAHLRDSGEERVLGMMKAAGLEAPTLVARLTTHFTDLAFYHASVSALEPPQDALSTPQRNVSARSTTA